MKREETPIIIILLEGLFYIIALPIVLIVLISKIIKKHKENVVLNAQYEEIKKKEKDS